MSYPQLVNALRMSEVELQQVVAELNRNRPPEQDSWRRRSRRWPCQFQRIVLTLEDGQSGRRHYAIVPRDISIDGICVIHGSFVHAGTRCAVTMRTVNWAAHTISGTVLRCHHLRGHLHELGISFHSRLSPRDYIVTFGDDYLFQSENVSPAELKGRVLAVQSSRADQMLLQHHYRNTSLELVFASDLATAMSLFKEPFDFALVDAELPDGDGISLMNAARRAGSTVPTVLISFIRDRDLRYAAIASGARELIFKPLEERILLQAAADVVLLEREHAAAASAMPEAVTVTRPGPEIVEAYCAEVQITASRLRGVVDSGDTAAIETICRRMSVDAPCFGFNALGMQAGSVIGLIEKKSAWELLRPEVETLLAMMARIGAIESSMLAA